MNIGVIKSPGSVNLGNDFIYYGAMHLLQKIFTK